MVESFCVCDPSKLIYYLFKRFTCIEHNVSSITNDNYFDVVVNFIALDLCVCVCESKAQIQART